jgi:hypothetical protein
MANFMDRKKCVVWVPEGKGLFPQEIFTRQNLHFLGKPKIDS